MAYRGTRHARQALQGIAVTQGGYVTSQQAGSVGYDSQHLAYHVRAGNLARVGWGLYRVPNLPVSPHDDLIRWTLWSRDRTGKPRAVVGDESALAVHDLGDSLPTTVHLIVPRTFRKEPRGGCRLHRAELSAADVEAHEGFGVTTAVRTVLDLAARMEFPARILRRAVAEAIESGKIRAPVLRARAERLDLSARLGLAVRIGRKKA